MAALDRLTAEFDGCGKTPLVVRYGGEVGERWKRLLALLETHLVTPEAEQAAVAAARDSFATLARWLTSPPPVSVA